MFAGNVWIYEMFDDYVADDTAHPRYCHRTLYLFAFWVTTSAYILMTCFVCCVSVTGIMLTCCKMTHETV